MKVLVLGGTGVIGSGIVNKCILNGFETFSLQRNLNSEAIYYKNVIYLNVDIKNYKSTRSILKGRKFDVVVDCLSFNTIDIRKTLSLLKNICAHYIFISSMAVFLGNSDEIITEKSCKCGNWEYTKGKIACENYLKVNKFKLGFPYTIVRPGITFGNSRIPYQLMYRHNHDDVLERILNSKPILLIENENIKDVITHIDDFSIAVIQLFLNPKTYYEDYNVIGDHRYSWIEVLDSLEKVIEKSIFIVHTPLKYVDIYFNDKYQEMRYHKAIPNYKGARVMNNCKIKAIVPEFSDTVSLKTALKDTTSYLSQTRTKTKEKDLFSFKTDAILFDMYLKKTDYYNEYTLLSKYIHTFDLKYKIHLLYYNVKVQTKYIRKKRRLGGG